MWETDLHIPTWSVFTIRRSSYLSFDMDASTNKSVAQARDRVMTDGLAAGFAMELIQWDGQYKGIDDFLLEKMQRKKE